MFRKTGTGVLGVALLLVCQWAVAQTTLRFAHAHPETDSQHKAATYFANEVNRGSEGRIRVLVYPNGQLGNDQTMINAVRGGSIDLQLSGNPYFTGMVPALNALDMPFLFRDAQEAYRVLDGEIGSELLGKLGDHGLQGLAFWEIGFRNLTNNSRPVRNAKDVRGLRLRTTPNPMHLRFFESLGANTVPMLFAEVYTALETRVIDGQENPVNLIRVANLESVQKHLSLTAHAYTAAPLVMNRQKFGKLAEADQRILVDAARKAATYQRRLNAEQEAGNLQALREAGMEVVDKPDRDDLQKVSADAMRKAVNGTPMETYLHRIRTSIDGADTRPEGHETEGDRKGGES